MCAGVADRDPTTVSSRRYIPSAGSVPASANSSTVPPGSTAASAVSPPPGAQRTAASTGPSGAVPARCGSRSTANTVSPRRLSTAPNSRPMNPFPTTSTRPRGTRSAPRSTHASGSTYGPACVVDRIRQLHPARRPHALGEPTRHDRRLGKPLARRGVPAQAARARAATRVVDQRDAASLRRSARRPRARAPSRGAESPIFSTSDPHSPQASTVTSSPGGAGSGMSASAGSLDASRTTARIGVS